MELAVIVVVVAVLVAGVVALVVARSRRGDLTTARPVPARPGPARPAATAAPPRPVSLGARLAKSRQAIGGRLAALFGRGDLDEDFWTGLEETLIAADVGVEPASEIVAAVRAAGPEDVEQARHLIRDELVAQFAGRDRTIKRDGKPAVLVVVGVNGSGKTTSIAKLAALLRSEGAEALLGAADTFRAAADEQLRTWAERVGVDVVGGQPGADPAAVAFDAYQAARSRGRDAVIVDTAGRLHSKHNLMQELGKVVRVLKREAGDLDEVLLVIDGTTGQNALAQAETFTEVVGVTGIMITKLDGTARGGVAVAVERRLGIPVKLIGVGEGVDDLIHFEPEQFVDALLGE